MSYATEFTEAVVFVDLRGQEVEVVYEVIYGEFDDPSDRWCLIDLRDSTGEQLYWSLTEAEKAKISKVIYAG